MKKIIILASILLAGCSADGKLGMEGSLAWHKRTTTAEKVQYFTPNCLEYGFKKGSVEFKKCIVDEIRASKADANARAASIRAYNAANRSVVCTTYGNVTRCN